MSELSNVKVGDVLVVTRHTGFAIIRELQTVTRLTKTLIVCGDDIYNHWGRVPGQTGYWATHAEPATKDSIASVQHENRARRVVNMCSRFSIEKALQTSDDKLYAIIDAISAIKGKAE